MLAAMNSLRRRSLQPWRLIPLVLAAMVLTACAATSPRAASKELPEPGEVSPRRVH
jgi:outer membrane PBP1 activator LpoA protein